MSTTTSLLCVRSRTLADVAIRAWDGDHTSHTAIRIEDRVIDATFRYGVKEWSLWEWSKGRMIVDDIPIYPSNPEAERNGIERLRARIGQRYDWLEIAGFVLLRDLGDPDRPVCSRLSYDAIHDISGLTIPGRQGRIAPRIVRATLTTFNQGLLAGRGRD